MNYALAIVSALLLIFCFPRFDLTMLAPVALAPLLIAAAREPRPWRRFLAGWMAGVVYWFGVCYWIQFVLSFHGGLGEVAGWAVFLLFCFAKALHMGVFAAAAGIAMRGWWAIPATAALWVAVEVTHGFLGFAWLALGNAGSEMSIPLRLAPLTGVYGLSFVFAMLGCALALAALRRPRIELLWLAPLPFLILLPALPDARRGREAAVLIQPDLSETEQWTEQSVDRMQMRIYALSQQALATLGSRGTQLLVWPELPGPFYYYEDPRLRSYVTDLARGAGVHFLLSVVGHTPDKQPLNSALLVSPAGEPVSRYDKIKLVPFGEFVPWPFGFAHNISSEISDFVPGSRVVVSPVGGHRIGSFICYESVFPHLVRKFAAGGAEVLFNLSNDGWFGKTAAREQHLKIVRMRAAENRRWIVRATNDGITAAIDPAGRVVQKLPLYAEAAARVQYSYLGDTTFYTRNGDWFALACAIAAAGAIAAAKFRRAG